MENSVLYEYRSFDNWKFILDIIVNKRMHAAPFHALNDPMEGRYFYFSNAVTNGFRRALYKSKIRRNILSLSRTKTNTLLWSYYAAGHTGVAFGVRQPKTSGTRIAVAPVTYDNSVAVRWKAKSSPDEIALRILTQKQMPWEHEKEVRVFSPTNFVPVAISELVLGCLITPADEALISQVARRWHPRIRITKLRRTSLDEPEAVDEAAAAVAAAGRN